LAKTDIRGIGRLNYAATSGTVNTTKRLADVANVQSNSVVIKSFNHKGLRKYFETGSKAGIQAKHSNRLRLQLAALDTARVIDDMDVPGYQLHPLKGRAKNRWSIWVSGNWRLTFEFKDGNAYILDYEDYH
jgi:proteic killer suppression protein